MGRDKFISTQIEIIMINNENEVIYFISYLKRNYMCSKLFIPIYFLDLNVD